MTLTGTLLDMLSYRRPMGSATEKAFIARYIQPLGAVQDDYQNYHVWIPNADGTPSRVLWSCHTDTVHKAEGRQTVRYDAVTGVIDLSKRAKRTGSNCLGADDTAGVFVLTELVKAGIPGHYVFHYGEERGGHGSGDLARMEPELLEPAEIAIALDRRGHGDIVTFQYGSRCASEAFATSLGAALLAVDDGLPYLSAHGIYTDTAEYTGIVAECTNLSIGYFHEHTIRECLDSVHVFQLLAALKRLDTGALIVSREPGEDDYEYAYLPGLGWDVKAKIGIVVDDTDVNASALCDCGHSFSDHIGMEYDCVKCDRCVGYAEAYDQRHTDTPPYLDPDYEAVQRALRKAQDSTRARIVLPWNRGKY
jgi:hypothetical protein